MRAAVSSVASHAQALSPSIYIACVHVVITNNCPDLLGVFRQRFVLVAFAVAVSDPGTFAQDDSRIRYIEVLLLKFL